MILSINNKINITLCGMMGSGKSTVGKILAKKLKYEFKDIDKIIEAKTNKSINRIFEEEGEKYFRDLEEKTTIEILENESDVKVMGPSIFESFSKCLDNALRITKGVLIGGLVLIITTIFL